MYTSDATQPDARPHRGTRPGHPGQATLPVVAVLQPVRFGEFLRDRHVIDDEQWLAALATHWSERRCSIGGTIAAQGVLSPVEIEREARAFHDLDLVEVGPSAAPPA